MGPQTEALCTSGSGMVNSRFGEWLQSHGEMAKWLKAAVSKTVRRGSERQQPRSAEAAARQWNTKRPLGLASGRAFPWGAVSSGPFRSFPV